MTLQSYHKIKCFLCLFMILAIVCLVLVQQLLSGKLNLCSWGMDVVPIQLWQLVASLFQISINLFLLHISPILSCHCVSLTSDIVRLIKHLFKAPGLFLNKSWCFISEIYDLETRTFYIREIQIFYLPIYFFLLQTTSWHLFPSKLLPFTIFSSFRLYPVQSAATSMNLFQET